MADLDRYVNYEEYYLKRIAKAKKAGADQIVGLCPFHEDRNESFGVDLKTGKCRCYAGCIEGNVISFHAKLNRCDTKEAYKDLCKIYGIPSDQKTKSAGKSDETIPVATLDLFKAIPESVLKFMQEKRGWSLEVIERFRIGYNEKQGFGSPGNIGAQRITIPVFDDFGNLVNIRSYQPGAEKYKLVSWSTGTKKKKTWQGFGETRLYPSGMIAKAREENAILYLVEGEPDSLCGISHGLFCATQTAGADTWKDEWNPRFKGMHVRLGYDNDEAGISGMLRVCKHLPSFAAKVECVSWPEFMGEKEDLTDWFMKHGKTKEDLEAPPWISAEDFLKQHEKKEDPKKEDPISQRILELNKKYAVAMLGGKCVIIQEFMDPVFGRKDINFIAAEDFKKFYANEKHFVLNGDGRVKQTSIGILWFESPLRRQYESIVFSPQKDISTHYNLYQGFAVEPCKGDWSLFFNHIKTVIANNDRQILQYILAWLAHLFQQPGGERPGVSIVLRGKQGVGKGCFAYHVGSILGKHYLHIANSKQLTGKFNNHLKDALFVFCDEGIWAGDKQAEGVLKAMVTETFFPIEPKGKDVFMVKNHIRLLVASNNSWVIPAGLEERRFCVLDVPDTRIQDHAYFGAIYRQMDNGGREAMLHDLLNLDISNFNLWDFPKTEALFDQIHETMNPVQKFWLEKLVDGSQLPGEDIWSDWVVTTKLYNDFITFCRNTGVKYPPCNRLFGKLLREICPNLKRKLLPSDQYGKRDWNLGFSPLEDCRKMFEEALGQTINWFEHDDTER